MVHTEVHMEESLAAARKPISSVGGVEAAKPGDTPVTGAVGLFLRVRATKKGVLTRRWIVRVTVNGRRPKFSLGSYPAIGLARARQLAQDAHSDVAVGKEPGARAKRRQQVSLAARSLTLSKAIDGWLANVAPAFKNEKSSAIRDRALRVHFAPLHSRDVASITVSDVAATLRKLAPETAVKSHSAIRAVFDYAAATLEPHGVTVINPADPRRLRSVGWSPKSRSENKPHAAIDWRIMPSVVSELGRMDEAATACVILMIATGMRAKTARLAKWANINLEARTWAPSLPDLKEKHHKRPFVIPLNDVALDVLKRPHASRFVFGPLSESTLNSFLRRLRQRHPDWVDSDDAKRPFTIHGFRATLRTWSQETNRLDADLAELSLGHKVHGDVSGRYIRTGLIEERRTLLEAWSRHLRGETSEVIAFRRG
jgi:integrase